MFSCASGAIPRGRFSFASLQSTGEEGTLSLAGRDLRHQAIACHWNMEEEAKRKRRIREEDSVSAGGASRDQEKPTYLDLDIIRRQPGKVLLLRL